MKLDKKDILHIGIIIIGMIFIALSIFHTNLWFDESYSVGLANHNFLEIWEIGSKDVHPILYYFILHIINLICGNNIIAYRIFSWICASIIGILGFTHIRKDFGKDVGIIFSFLAFFLPVNIVYAGEIRMYTLAMLLVTLMAIYAYRIYKNKNEKNTKNWILFAIFSLLSAYTHYYALVTAGIINIILFIYFIKESLKEKKFTYNLKVFLVSAVAQIILYLPWLISLILQIKHVSSGFWIVFSFPKSVIEFFNFQFTGNLGDEIYLNSIVAGVFGILICIYMIYAQIKNVEKEKPELYSILVWLLLVIAVIIASVLMKKTIVYARYMLCVMGLFIFFISYTMARKGNKYITTLILVISLVLSVFAQLELSKVNYDENNSKGIKYIKKNIQENDIILHGNDTSSFVVDVNFQNNKAYFWNKENWSGVEAYEAYGTNFSTESNLEKLKNYQGRIWIIYTNNEFVEGVSKELENIEILQTNSYEQKYHNMKYKVMLVEKN